MHKIKNRVGPLRSGTCVCTVHGFDSNFVFFTPVSVSEGAEEDKHSKREDNVSDT